MWENIKDLFQDSSLIQKIGLIILLIVVFGLVILWFILADFREYNYRAWFGE